jgi:hypothetical protein
MADRQDDNPVEDFVERTHGSDLSHPEPRGALPSLPPGACPECASLHFTLIRDTEIVSVYKCSNCGSLAAPVKKS